MYINNDFIILKFIYVLGQTFREDKGEITRTRRTDPPDGPAGRTRRTDPKFIQTFLYIPCFLLLVVNSHNFYFEYIMNYYLFQDQRKFLMAEAESRHPSFDRAVQLALREIRLTSSTLSSTSSTEPTPTYSMTSTTMASPIHCGS